MCQTCRLDKRGIQYSLSVFPPKSPHVVYISNGGRLSVPHGDIFMGNKFDLIELKFVRCDNTLARK